MVQQPARARGSAGSGVAQLKPGQGPSTLKHAAAEQSECGAELGLQWGLHNSISAALYGALASWEGTTPLPCACPIRGHASFKEWACFM